MAESKLVGFADVVARLVEFRRLHDWGVDLTVALRARGSHRTVGSRRWQALVQLPYNIRCRRRRRSSHLPTVVAPIVHDGELQSVISSYPSLKNRLMRPTCWMESWPSNEPTGTQRTPPIPVLFCNSIAPSFYAVTFWTSEPQSHNSRLHILLPPYLNLDLGSACTALCVETWI